MARALLACLLIVVAISAPAAAQTGPPTLPPPTLATGPSDDLVLAPREPLPDDLTERAAELDRRIAAADVREVDLVAQIEATELRRQALDAQIADLVRQREGLDAQLRALSRDLDRTTSAYLTAERALEDSRERLYAARDQARRRVMHMYKEGPAGMVNFVLGAKDLEDASTRVSYVRRVFDHDRETMSRLRTAEDEYRARSTALDDAKAQQLSGLNRVSAVRGEIAGNLSRQEQVRESVDAETTRKRSVLARIQADRAAWQALVARQQQDSSSIAELLARSQTGQPPAAGVIAGFLTVPVIGEVTSPFGHRVHPIFGVSRFHSGLDIAADEGTTIAAPADGTVVFAGEMGGYGNAVVLDHGQRVATLHGHQSAIAVTPGNSVRRGQVIGYVGSTGYSTGPHLHLEVRLDGAPTDPVPWLRLV